MPQPVRFRARGSRAGRPPSGARRAAWLLAGAALGCAWLWIVPAHAQQVVSGQIYIPGPGDRGGADAASMTAMVQAPSTAPAGGLAASPRPAVPAGMITIPGRGEKTADAGDASPAPTVITIPGPGERAGRIAAASLNEVSVAGTVKAPSGVERANAGNAGDLAKVANRANAANTANANPAYVANAANFPNAAPRAPAALQRVSFASAANRVAPVVVGAPPTVAQPAVALHTAQATRNRPAGTSAAAATARATGAPAVAARAAVGVASAPSAVAAAAPAQPNAAAPAAATTATAAGAPPVPAGQQDGESIRAAALAYLQQQSAGLPGRVSITVSPVFPRGLAACTSLEPFMPPGARTWGRTTVGVRCVGQRPWTLYVQARVAVQVTYYTAARPIGPGETLAAIDLQPRDGDLASLPRTVITDPSQALGAVSLARIAAGLPLRTDMLRSAASVVIGQTVRLVAAGPNFTISTEGSVLNNAAPGQRVEVRTGGGQIVTGIVKDAATVDVQI